MLLLKHDSLLERLGAEHVSGGNSSSGSCCVAEQSPNALCSFVDMHDQQQSKSQLHFVLSVLGTNIAEIADIATTVNLSET